jgi:chemotaxis protein MotB
MSAEITRRGLVISLEGTSFFESGSAQLRQDAYPLLDRIASILAPFENPIRVEGFTDNLATSNYPSNWELSANRAASVVRHLMARGLRPGHLAATGYGEHYPVADNGTEEGRRRNRRVDIVLLAGADASTSL